MDSNSSNGNANPTSKQKSNSNELVKIDHIQDTPFTAVKHDKEWYLCMGKYRLTKALATKKDVLANAKDVSWNRLMSVIQIMIDENKAIDKLKQQAQPTDPNQLNLTLTKTN